MNNPINVADLKVSGNAHHHYLPHYTHGTVKVTQTYNEGSPGESITFTREYQIAEDADVVTMKMKV